MLTALPNGLITAMKLLNKPAALPRKQSGFALFETLVSVVVLSTGLLGVAAMQYTGLRDNNRATERSLATIIAYDMIDRMRANTTGSRDGDYRIPDPSVPPTALGVYDCITDFTGTATTGICSPAEMANADLVDWWTNSLSTLPSAAASIICVDSSNTSVNPCPADALHIVTIMWDDARTGAAGFACSGDETTDRLCMAVDADL